MNVEQVDFVSVPTRDIGRAVRFYRDVLGLPESEYSEGEVEAPNVTFGFWAPEADGEEFVPNTAGVGLRVPNVASAVEEARAAGAESSASRTPASATWASSRIPTATC